MREGRRQLGWRDDHATEAEEQDPDQVGQREHALGAQGPGQEQGERDEGPGAGQGQQQGGEQTGPVRVPAEGEAHSADHHELQELDGQHREGLGHQEAAPAERAHAEQAQHAVTTVEGGGDRLAGERRGDHGQGQHAWHGHVDPAVWPE